MYNTCAQPNSKSNSGMVLATQSSVQWAIWLVRVSHLIGTSCYVQVDGNRVACNYYVKCWPSDSVSDFIPLNRDFLGMGCMVEGRSYQYQNFEYSLTKEERDSMCIDLDVANSAAQLRFGSHNGYCRDDPTEIWCQTKVPSPAQYPTQDWCALLNQPDNELFDLSLVDWDLLLCQSCLKWGCLWLPY